MPSRPSASSLQNDSASFAPPGKRHPIPMMAIGSADWRLSRSRFEFNSAASRASRFGDSLEMRSRKSLTDSPPPVYSTPNVGVFQPEQVS